MEGYKILSLAGEGSSGKVYKAIDRRTGDLVAMKKMKKLFFTWDDCLRLREVQALRRLTHPNIVKLKEVFRISDDLWLIFDFYERDLLQVMESQRARGQHLTDETIREILKQALQGLAFSHKHGFFHRDLRPEHLMLHRDTCAIADYGLARPIGSRPPYTDYVGKRWYRAPEVLLRSSRYDEAVDVFAMGCIMAEMYSGKPLAAGKNENDQMHKLCEALGTPERHQWTEGFHLADAIGYYFPQCPKPSFSLAYPRMSYEAVTLMSEMLQWDPSQRPRIADILTQPYFTHFIEPGMNASYTAPVMQTEALNPRQLLDPKLPKESDIRPLKGRGGTQEDYYALHRKPKALVPTLASVSNSVALSASRTQL